MADPIRQVDPCQPLTGVDLKVRAVGKNLHSPICRRPAKTREKSLVLSTEVPLVGKSSGGRTGAADNALSLPR